MDSEIFDKNLHLLSQFISNDEWLNSLTDEQWRVVLDKLLFYALDSQVERQTRLVEERINKMKIDIDGLEAGEELDTLIARKVMGWTCLDKGWWETPGGEAMTMSCFKPSTDISAAWQVVARIRKLKTATFGLECFSQMDDRWQATFKGDLDIEKASFELLKIAYADTAPLAICRAALKVVQND